MRFEWDETKNAENRRKHKIDFADVPSMFSGPMLTKLDNRQNYGGNVGLALVCCLPWLLSSFGLNAEKL